MKFEINNLKESNEFLNILLENLSSAVFIVDEEFRVKQFNNTFEIFFSYDGQKLLDMHCGNAIKCGYAVQENKPCGQTSHCYECILRKSILKTFTGHVPVYRQILVRDFFLDNKFSKRHFQYTTKYIYFNDKKMVLLIMDDVTELEEQRIQLKESNEKMKREIELARKLQIHMLPKTCPETKFFRISGYYSPMEELGGDFYDFYVYCEREALFMISDVSGHGVSASLVTAMQKALFNEICQKYSTTGEILTNLNRMLYNVLHKTGYFLTAFWGIIDMEKKVLEYTNSGHPKAIFLRKDKPYKLLPLESQDPPTGILYASNFTTLYEKIDHGDRIFLYTDGILEVMDNQRNLFGIDKLIDIVVKYSNLEHDKLIKRVLESIEKFADGNSRSDDITMVIIDIL